MNESVVKRFWRYVEVPTKVASLLPFILALLYAAYRYHQISVLRTSVFFISMLSFDLSVTALNNYMDSKADGTALPFSKAVSKGILCALWAFALSAGLLLVYYTGPVVLVCGGLCFCVGILYSYGPVPISRMPLGEVISGVFMGFFIPFLVVYINAPVQSLVWYSYQSFVLEVSVNIANLFSLAVLMVPAVLGIANIMFANNICDVEKDIKVKRLTLPYYIGNKNALRLYTLLYIAAYAAVIALAVFRILPPYVLIVLLGLTAVQINIRKFKAFQSKKETFPLSIVNFLILIVPLILVTAAAALI